MSKRFQTQPSILLLVQKLKDGCVFMWSYFLYSKIKFKKIGYENFQQKLTLQPSFSLAAIFYLLPCLKVFSTGVNLPNALWIILIRCGEAEIRSVFQKCILLTAKLTPERYLKFWSFIRESVACVKMLFRSFSKKCKNFFWETVKYPGSPKTFLERLWRVFEQIPENFVF